MRYSYDADVDALSIELRPDSEITHTIEVDDARHIDLDASDQVVAIEILWASTGFEVDDLVDRFNLWEYKAFLQDIAQKSFKPAVSI
jgi:uncharacterized protein YuzE